LSSESVKMSASGSILRRRGARTCVSERSPSTHLHEMLPRQPRNVALGG
jgi:hypothetical protein